jgi:phosphoserine phosphatase RsbU/P
MNQRTIYKLVDALLETTVEDPIDMLSSLVQYLVDNDRTVMTGGRVWELDPTDHSYVLRSQYGELESLDLGSRRHLEEMPATLSASNRSSMATAPIDVPGRGMRTYSLIGVGDPDLRDESPLHPYALAFTTTEQSEEFIDTMLVVASAATTALRNRTQRERDTRMQRDLDQAWQIQHGLVPNHQRSFRDYDLHGISIPDRVVGGDYFDYLGSTEVEDRLGVVISDAASKGLPAAAQALFVSGAMRMGMSFETKMSSLIARLNQLIYTTFPNERFVSLFYAELMPSSSGLVLYVNAGHCPPLLLERHPEGGFRRRELQPTGGILGIIEDQTYTVENINLLPGSILLLYTDGITEAQNSHGELYGEQRLWSLLEQHASATSQAIAQAILDDVTQFAVHAVYTDDKTLVVIKRHLSAPSH